MNYIAERRLEEKERRRAEIVDAAEAAGREVGLDALTMDDVARRARLSRALLYVYFQDRSDLMFGLAERAMTMLHARFVEAAERHRTGLEQVSAIGARMSPFAGISRAFRRAGALRTAVFRARPGLAFGAGLRTRRRSPSGTLVASIETGAATAASARRRLAHADECHALGIHARNHPAHHHQGVRADSPRSDGERLIDHAIST